MGGIILTAFLLSVLLFASIVNGDEVKIGKFIAVWFGGVLVYALISGF